MKHVLLTGATGFLGSHLLEALIAQGHQVTILKRSTSDTWRIDHLLDRVSSFDVDQVALEDAFKLQKVDAVIHTVCCYGRNGEAAHEVVETNLGFGLKVLEAAMLSDTEAFINTDTLLPKYLNVYSLSKKHFSEWLRHCSKNIKVVNLKLEHMYGPKDDSSKFVPWLISRLEQGAERIPLTEGSQLRDFIYIDDVVSAYLLMLQKIDQLVDYNQFDVGTGQFSSVRDFVTNIFNIYKSMRPDTKTKLGFGDIPTRDGELMSVELDNTELKAMGWCAKVSQNQGLERFLKAIL